MDGEALITGSFQRRHVPGVLRVPFERFGNAISFDESRYRDVPSTQVLDRRLETGENRLRRSTRIEPLETLPLNVRDELRRRSLSSFDAPDFELVLVGDLSEVLGQRAGVALALGDEGDPVVVSFVFESDIDGVRNLRRERLEIGPLGFVDAGIRRHPDRIHDAVDDPPSAVFQASLRGQ